LPSTSTLNRRSIIKIGRGSLGGKAKGLSFLATLLASHPELYQKFSDVDLLFPETIVITTDGFDDFIADNALNIALFEETSDQEIAAQFLEGNMPQWIKSELNALLQKYKFPLAIRSSSLLEDARFRAFAGLYRTHMLPNNHPDLEKRLQHLIQTIKLIYASTYFKAPRSFGRRVGHHYTEEKMAVIIQQVVGNHYGDSFYPAISGVAQSHNYYPYAQMKPEDGIATIAMGLGTIVVEGERALRFSPKHPKILPYTDIEDILKNAQRYFYSIKMEKNDGSLTLDDKSGLTRREVTDVAEELPMQQLASTYIPEEQRIRDTTHISGYRVLTFASVLKFGRFPLADILTTTLDLCRKEMKCPIEMEFAVNLNSPTTHTKPQFAFLQLRPMGARGEQEEILISGEEQAKAFCRSSHALGNAVKQNMQDIVYVRPDRFDASQTIKIAQEIRRLNLELTKAKRTYVLIGPGRWGSRDHWLGIPVAWQDISAVGAIIETTSDKIRSEPSQGSHFFHNISTIGIHYFTIGATGDDYLDWDWLLSQPSQKKQTTFVAHVTLPSPMILKVDGRKLQGIIYI
jgi:hypothetical protein